MKMAIIVSFLIGCCGLESWAQEAEQVKSAQSYAVEFVLDHVPCDNADEVARLVFGEYSADIFTHERSASHIYFGTQDLGDGEIAYIFAPPAGNGTFAVVPNYHFVKVGDSLRLVFDGGGANSEYLDEQPKLNGRYQIVRRNETESDGMKSECYFWDGKHYIVAYSTNFLLDDEEPSGLLNSIAWQADEAVTAFLSSHVTWEHEVDRWDTLSSIALQYATAMSEIAAQNNIQDLDPIRVGEILRYDSAKTDSGRHFDRNLGRTEAPFAQLACP